MYTWNSAGLPGSAVVTRTEGESRAGLCVAMFRSRRCFLPPWLPTVDSQLRQLRGRGAKSDASPPRAQRCANACPDVDCAERCDR